MMKWRRMAEKTGVKRKKSRQLLKVVANLSTVAVLARSFQLMVQMVTDAAQIPRGDAVLTFCPPPPLPISRAATASQLPLVVVRTA